MSKQSRQRTLSQEGALCPWRTEQSRRGWAGQTKAWEEVKGRPGLLQGLEGEEGRGGHGLPHSEGGRCSPLHSTEPGSPQEGDRQGCCQAKRRFNHHHSRMTSTVYYSYMNGPSHWPSAIPWAHRDEHSHNPFPIPESCPVIHSRHKVPVWNTRHGSPSSGRGVSPSLGRSPLGEANRAAGTLSN